MEGAGKFVERNGSSLHQKDRDPEKRSWKRAKPLRVASLFCGAGGMDLGFKLAGHKVVWANDIDADSVETYRKNLGNHIVLGNVADIRAEQVPSIDALIGGLPCQGFSRANINKVSGDERNDLYAQFVRILKGRRPTFFVIENVRGMLSLDGGSAFATIVSTLDSVGYDVQHKVLNAADFGVPQTRIRLFVVGVRRDKAREFRYEFPKPTHARSAKSSDGMRPWVTVDDALRTIPEPGTKHSLVNHVCSAYKVTNRDFTGHRKTDPQKPSPTILARGDGGGGVCAIPHPNNHRRMSVRESALIQTFPKKFEFVGGINSMYRQVGNAVPPTLAKLVATGFQELK